MAKLLAVSITTNWGSAHELLLLPDGEDSAEDAEQMAKDVVAQYSNWGFAAVDVNDKQAIINEVETMQQAAQRRSGVSITDEVLELYKECKNGMDKN